MEHFKAPHEHPVPHFSLSLFVSFFLVPTGNATSDSYDIKQLPLIFFDIRQKCSMNKAL